MKTPRVMALVLSATIVASVGFLSAAPAAAAPLAETYAVAASTAQGEVTGQGWSAPAFDVKCISTGLRINCSPTTISDSVSERCFNGVSFNGTDHTVCSTSESNIQAIQDDGGTELKIDFRCALLDPSCTIGQVLASGLALSIGTGLSWAIGQTSFNSDSRLWEASIAEWAWWQGAIILIILGAGIVAVVMAAVTGDRADMVTAVSRFALSLPLSAASLWIVGKLLDIVDRMTVPIISRTGGAGGLEKFMENLLFGGGGGNLFLANLTLLILYIGTVVLVAVFSFRNFALAALISMGPVAWMLFPTTFGKQWVVRYFSAVIALILTTPLTLGLLSLVITGIGKVDTLWSIQALPFGIGLCMIAFVPVAAFSMLSFIGGTAADSIGSRMGSSAIRQTSRGVSMARGAASRANAVRRRGAQPHSAQPRTSSSSASSSGSQSRASAPSRSSAPAATTSQSATPPPRAHDTSTKRSS